MGKRFSKPKRKNVTSRSSNRSDEVTSEDITLSSTQDFIHPSNMPSGSNNALQLTGDQSLSTSHVAAGTTSIQAEHLQVTSNTFQIAAGATRQGTLDPDTLMLKLTEAKTTFVPTKSFEDIRRCLEQNCHVTICGASGEGKTTMALMLGDKYRKQGYDLVFVDRPEVFDLGSCISSGQKICLIFDDIFGPDGQSTNFSHVNRLCDTLKLHIDNSLKLKLNDAADRKKDKPNQVRKGSKKKVPDQVRKDSKKKVPDQVRKDSNKPFHQTTSFKSKELRVIFTTKTYNFKDGVSRMQFEPIFNKSVVDLTVNPECYSNQEKRAIFEKHREMNPRRKLEDTDIEEVINQDSSLFGFPLTCRLFFNFSTFDDKVADFFRRPIYYLRRELNPILKRGNEQAAALILVLLCEGNVKLSELESQNRSEKVDEMLMHVISFTNSVSRSSIASAAKNFRGTFLSRGDNLCFAHSSIYDACACALFQVNPTFVIQYCSLEFLYDRLKPGTGTVVETGISDKLHYLFISEEYFPLVITRFVSSLKEGVFSKTVAHPIMQNELFVKTFVEEACQSTTDNRVWIQWKELGKGFLYWVVKSKSIYLVENIEKILEVTFTDDDIREALIAAVECDSLSLFKLFMGKLEEKLHMTDLNKHLLASGKSSGKEMVKYLLQIGANVSSIDRSGQTFLHLLCTYDRPKILQLVTTHAQKEALDLAYNMFDDDKRTPLMLAALHGTWNCFKLIKDSVKPSVKESLIHLACKGGNMEIVKNVLTQQNLNQRDESGKTPIMVAASGAKSDIFDLLLSKHANITLADEDGDRLVHHACFGGDKHIVERVLTPQNINSKGRFGRTPILVSALAAKVDIFHLLLLHKADVTLVNENGQTLLHYACAGGNIHIVESVMTPQKMNIESHCGLTPIMVAAQESNQDVFDILLSKGADVTLVDEDGNTLLHHACIGGNTHIVERVLTPQNINRKGRFKTTPIMIAAKESKPDVFDLLLSKGADVTLVDENGDTLLHLACIGGNTHIVERVLTPQNINRKGMYGYTPIMWAAKESKPDVFDLLLSKGADITLVDEDGDTLLHHTCIGGNTHIVERVLTPQNINRRGMNGYTPVMWAAQESKPDVFDLLLSKGADVTLVDEDGDTLLHHTCIGGNTHIVERVLSPQNINRRGMNGYTPIIWAAKESKPDVFDLLLSKGADVTLVDENGNALLHLACVGGNTHIVERVLTPQNINRKGMYGYTPIMWAAQESKPDVFDLLLSKGADVTLVDENGNALLHLACAGGNTHIVERVLTPQNINRKGMYGYTPIMWAAKESKSDVFDLLLSKGADITLVDEDGDTLLHHTCIGGNTHIVERVLTPQNINRRDMKGHTPIMWAARESKPDVFDLLLSKGADVTLVDENGNALLHLACIGGNTHIVERVLTPQNINRKGWFKTTPIMIAAKESKPDVFDLLLSKGADVTLVDENGNALLHHTCVGGNTHIVERVLTPQNINRKGWFKTTPIMIAAKESKPDVFDLLLSKGADVTLVDEDGDTLLHLACIGGNTHIVERVLTPQNINRKGMYGYTPIMWAAKESKPDVFDLLLSKGADITLVDEDGDTLLHHACIGGNPHIVERVLSPQNINRRGMNGYTPIIWAAKESKPDVFDLLLSKGADVTLVDENGNALLHLACVGGNTHIVERVLTPQNINRKGMYGYTPIMWAAQESKPDVFDLLLSKGADVTLVDENGNALLHLACAGGNTHIVERVLTPQNINRKGWCKTTPIMIAAKESKPDVFDLLLSKGADVTLVDEDGDTLLHHTCIGGNTHIVERVLTPQNINRKGMNGYTPIMIAAKESKPDVFDLLLSKGADVTLVDEDGDTLLHHTCIGGNTHIVERVLTPQNINRRDMKGHTPIMWAARESKPDVFDLLLSKGADVTLVDENGNALLHLACIGGNTHIVERVLTPQNINRKGWFKTTPIMIAAKESKPDVFDLLLSKGADVTLVDENGNALLHHTCVGGNTHIVERALTPQNINRKGWFKTTPIMIAAKESKPDVFDLLLSKGADVTLVDEDGDTLLHLACIGGNTHIVERVLTPQNINRKGMYGYTPIMWAAKESKPDVFDLLLSKGADITLVDEDGDTLLHHACIGGNPHIVERVLTPQNINRKGMYGYTPIMWAAQESKPDVFDLLLSKGADVTLVDENGNALLHLACAGGNTHIVERVLTPQNINRKGMYGYTPIMWAAKESKSDVFDLLLSKGADITLVDEDGDTLLHHTCIGGNTHIVERVLTPQNINRRDMKGHTPLMWAAKESKPDVFDLLLSKGADVTLVDENGNTLLHLACIGGNTHIVERILTPQNINRRGMKGFTPVMCAAQEGHINIVSYLCEKGADLTCLTSDGRGVVAVAEVADKKEVVKYLKSRVN